MARPDTPAPARPVAALVLGTDAVMHARPLSPARLAEACRRAGYESVVPASWGDELVAAACLETLPRVAPGPAALCACPLVASMAGTADEVARLSFAPPPVAAARYVRELYGARPVHVTFAGRCPGANDPAIDERISPETLLAELRERLGLTPRDVAAVSEAAEPEMVHSSERRFRSLPGGAPDVSWLAAVDGYVLDAGDEIGVPAHERTLYDLAAAAGCVCAGALGAGDTAEAARGAVLGGEPERGTEPVVADARAGQLARAMNVPTVRGGRATRRPPPPVPRPTPTAAAPVVPPLATPVGTPLATPAVTPAAEAPGSPVTPGAVRAVDPSIPPAARTRTGPPPVLPHARREIGTLLLPRTEPAGQRKRRRDTPPTHEVHPSRIRPHKSSEPDWDGPRRFPLFSVVGGALIVGVTAFAYLHRSQPYVPPIADVATAPRAATPPAAVVSTSRHAPGGAARRVDSTARPTLAAATHAPAAASPPPTSPPATTPAARPTPAPTPAAATGATVPARVAARPATGELRAVGRLAPTRAKAGSGTPAPAVTAPHAPTVGASENPAAAAALAAELRREIAARRARVDSLAQKVESLTTRAARSRPPR